jgi:hypothetical protein
VRLSSSRRRVAGPRTPPERLADDSRWGLYQDGEDPRRFVEVYFVPCWQEHLRQHTDRLAGDDQELELKQWPSPTGLPPSRTCPRASCSALVISRHVRRPDRRTCRTQHDRPAGKRGGPEFCCRYQPARR